MRRIGMVFVGALALSWFVTTSHAQIAALDAASAADVIKEIEPPPPPYTLNSAIVLTNPFNRPAGFKIELYDNDGNVAGGGSVEVAPKAMEVIWVSRLLRDQGSRFVGWGVAKSDRPLKCNAFLAGAGFTNLPVESHRVRNSDVQGRRKIFSVLAAL